MNLNVMNSYFTPFYRELEGLPYNDTVIFPFDRQCRNHESHLANYDAEWIIDHFVSFRIEPKSPYHYICILKINLII